MSVPLVAAAQEMVLLRSKFGEPEAFGTLHHVQDENSFCIPCRAHLISRRVGNPPTCLPELLVGVVAVRSPGGQGL